MAQFLLQDHTEHLLVVLLLNVQELEVALHHVDEKVGERDQIVAPAQRVEAHRVLTAQCHVADEVLAATELNMLVVFSLVLRAKAKVNQPYLIE